MSCAIRHKTENCAPLPKKKGNDMTMSSPSPESIARKTLPLPANLPMKGAYVDNGILSNVTPNTRPMLWRNELWPNVESIYVAEKNPHAIVRGMPFWRLVLKHCAENGCHGIKRLGKPKSRGGLIDPLPDWDIRRIGAMAGATTLKFAPGTHEAQWLAATPQSRLVEWNNWRDQFWGMSFRPPERTATGRNILGMLLMMHKNRLAAGRPLFAATPDNLVALGTSVTRFLLANAA